MPTMLAAPGLMQIEFVPAEWDRELDRGVRALVIIKLLEFHAQTRDSHANGGIQLGFEVVALSQRFGRQGLLADRLTAMLPQVHQQ